MPSGTDTSLNSAISHPNPHTSAANSSNRQAQPAAVRTPCGMGFSGSGSAVGTTITDGSAPAPAVDGRLRERRKGRKATPDPFVGLEPHPSVKA